MKLRPGRYIYGLGAIAFGIITLNWHQVNPLGNISRPVFFIYLMAIFEIIGGLTIQWQRTKKFGALTLGAVYFIFTLYLLQFIFEIPLDYHNWGNFFEELSVALGSVFVLLSTLRSDHKRGVKITRIAFVSYGICVISYSLYQLFYLPYTASLVPEWIPLGRMFWAAATTIAFALAAFAILSGYRALLAARLLTLTFIGFCLLVWLPRCISDPHNISNWIGNAQTFAVAGTAWIVADFLYHSKTTSL